MYLFIITVYLILFLSIYCYSGYVYIVVNYIFYLKLYCMYVYDVCMHVRRWPIENHDIPRDMVTIKK